MPESEDRGIAVMRGVAANDNGRAAARIDSAVMTLARLIGRRIARPFRGAAGPNAARYDIGIDDVNITESGRTRQT